MNLWRVPIDERHRPRPRRAGAGDDARRTGAACFSFSRDGTRLAFASLDYRSTLLRATFDPVKRTLTGPPVPCCKGSRPIRDHRLSPDGEWIAFNEAGAQRGSVRRPSRWQPVPAAHRRRVSRSWAGLDAGRDAHRFLFRSRRRLRPLDDSAGRQRADRNHGQSRQPRLPRLVTRWPAHGIWLRREWHIVSLAARRGPAPTKMPEPPSPFAPASWSPDGQRIVGLTGLPVMGLTVFSIATQQFTPVPGEITRGYRVFPPGCPTDGESSSGDRRVSPL